MAYYDSLIAQWPNLTGSPDEKIAQINGLSDGSWWQANGYSSPISIDDCDAAGLLSQDEINQRWPNRAAQIAFADEASKIKMYRVGNGVLEAFDAQGNLIADPITHPSQMEDK